MSCEIYGMRISAIGRGGTKNCTRKEQTKSWWFGVVNIIRLIITNAFVSLKTLLLSSSWIKKASKKNCSFKYRKFSVELCYQLRITITNESNRDEREKKS